MMAQLHAVVGLRAAAACGHVSGGGALYNATGCVATVSARCLRVRHTGCVVDLDTGHVHHLQQLCSFCRGPHMAPSTICGGVLRLEVFVLLTWWFDVSISDHHQGDVCSCI
jgi:hypothetical protein